MACAGALAMGIRGAGFNPARAFGPALCAGGRGDWAGQWIYWLGDVIGASLAVSAEWLMSHYGKPKHANAKATKYAKLMQTLEGSASRNASFIREVKN
jgi:hypothetical protein